MHCVACVLIQGFYAGTIAAHEVGPVVVFREKHVLDANPPAIARGVRIGQPLAMSKAILIEEGKFVPWQEDRYRAASHEWLELCAEVSESVEPLDQHVALVDLSFHGRPEEIVSIVKERIQKRTGYLVRVGIGATRWVAKLAAESDNQSLIPLITPRQFVSQFPTSALPVDPVIISRLIALGYHSIGEVAALSQGALMDLFGPIGMEVLLSAIGGGACQVLSEYPSKSLAVRQSFEGAVEDRLQLDFGLGELAGKVSEACSEKEVSGSALTLVIELEDGQAVVLKRTFSKPLSGRKQLHASLLLLLPEELPPVRSLLARVCGLKQTTRLQKDLDGLAGRSDRKLSLESALAQVRGVFGSSSIQRLADKEDPRFAQVRRAWSQVYGWNWA